MTTLPLAIRLARRELRGGLKGFGVFLACLTLGVAAIASVGTLVAGVNEALKNDGQRLLGGDVELSFTHRPATAEQKRFIDDSGRVSTVIEMRAMARTDDRRTLIELKAVDGEYPLLGAVRLAGNPDLTAVFARRDGLPGAAAERTTLNRLGIGVGDRLSIGDATFVVRAVIENEPDRSANVLTLGPRVMIALGGLPATGLVQPGSLVRYQYRIMLADGIDPAGWIDGLKTRFPDAGWRIRSPSEAAPGVQRWIERIGLYLTLVGLTALLVGGVGVANAVASYLDGKTATIATLKCLGAPGHLVVQVYLVQIMVMAALGIGAGLALGALAPIVFGKLVASQLPVAAQVGFYPLPMAIAGAFGLLTALTFSLWPLARAREVPPAALFRSLVAPSRRWPRGAFVAGTAAAAGSLAALTVVTAADRPLAVSFVIGTLAAFALFRGAAWIIARLARSASHVRMPAMRLALANMHRPGSPTPGIVLSLGIGLTVLVMIALIQGNLARQIREQLPEIAPSFFFIDLQPDQTAAFDALMRDLPGVGEVKRVPALRGRIARIAGVPVEQANIAPDAQWAIGSDRGLTYASELPAGARIVAGQWWPADYSGPPLVSFDGHIAKGMGLGLGDTITINVLGREIEARIANLRAIDWTTLGINFTLIFAPGTLEGAPHTFIATAEVAPEHEDAVERAVTERFANVSSIRVKTALAAVETMLSGIAAAARVTAAVTLVAGTLVLAGAIIATQRRRIYDAVVLKVLGARRRAILGALVVEFALLGAAAVAVAAAIGSIAAYLLMTRYMHIDFVFLPLTVAGTALATVAVVVAVGLAGTWRALGHKPAPLLRNA
ncbi:MAG: FtsX-like permease family protein [Rhodospirillales bacterium]|nr:FtsX-like permease family protein [Rhodospirillales bacterium]